MQTTRRPFTRNKRNEDHCKHIEGHADKVKPQPPRRDRRPIRNAG